MKKEFFSKSPEDTKEIAKKIIEKIPNTKKAKILALTGDLGAGKTNFTQGVGEFLGVKRTITSPTFVLMKKYKVDQEDQKYSNFFHLDCYRIHSKEELLDLGWSEMITKHENLILLEWGERVKDILPEDTVWVIIDTKGKNKRKITVILKEDEPKK
ncbi:MAG: tRNA (adenosine(37)-N6)-threonylcarbamoyltransferase complex ATPase subunit type 1 TsaE [Candidatus Spechtbacterales bacterium]|nr:tRNA (adenosine(37)-N6)-threonylcarbamoyltransferase complex ATPase subunit type 1 TsaE [Candidatus Spechtbacterales bacterium]